MTLCTTCRDRRRDGHAQACHRCPACGSCSRASFTVCPGCRQATDRRLRDLPDLYDQLGELLEPGSVGTRLRVSGSHRSDVLPVRLDVLNLRQHGGLVGVLDEWEADFRDLKDLPPAPARGSTRDSLAGVVEFLRVHLPWASAFHPAADDLVREVRELTAACRRALGEPGRRRVPIGACPVPLLDVPCAEPLFADPDEPVITCGRCATSWSLDEWAELGRAMAAVTDTSPATHSDREDR